MKKNGSNVNIRFEQLSTGGGERLAVLDELRGLAIVNMVAYHLCYDLTVIYGFDWPWFFSFGAEIWQKYICISFLLIAGICTRHSTRPVIRALKICFCALLVSAATYLALPDQAIYFGILHCMGASMLLCAIFRRMISRGAPIVGLVVSLILILLTWNLSDGFIGIGAAAFRLPEILYSTPWLFPLGLRDAAFRSADYFPLLPWFFVFLAGAFAGGWTLRASSGARAEHIRPLAFLGRHSLFIYVLHQPVMVGVLSLVF
jgi:uncharacterized membrane protein